MTVSHPAWQGAGQVGGFGEDTCLENDDGNVDVIFSYVFIAAVSWGYAGAANATCQDIPLLLTSSTLIDANMATRTWANPQDRRTTAAAGEAR